MARDEVRKEAEKVAGDFVETVKSVSSFRINRQNKLLLADAIEQAIHKRADRVEAMEKAARLFAFLYLEQTTNQSDMDFQNAMRMAGFVGASCYSDDADAFLNKLATSLHPPADSKNT